MLKNEKKYPSLLLTLTSIKYQYLYCTTFVTQLGTPNEYKFFQIFVRTCNLKKTLSYKTEKDSVCTAHYLKY